MMSLGLTTGSEYLLYTTCHIMCSITTSISAVFQRASLSLASQLIRDCTTFVISAVPVLSALQIQLPTIPPWARCVFDAVCGLESDWLAFAGVRLRQGPVRHLIPEDRRVHADVGHSAALQPALILFSRRDTVNAGLNFTS